jgi:hypothetical protein
MAQKPRKLGEVRRRKTTARPVNPGDTRKQLLRDLVRDLYGTTQGKNSNMTNDQMYALILSSRDSHDPETGRLRADLFAEAVEMMVEQPPREPVCPDIVKMPDGRWALSSDAVALNDLAEQAHAAALLADARATFA